MKKISFTISLLMLSITVSAQYIITAHTLKNTKVKGVLYEVTDRSIIITTLKNIRENNVVIPVKDIKVLYIGRHPLDAAFDGGVVGAKIKKSGIKSNVSPIIIGAGINALLSIMKEYEYEIEGSQNNFEKNKKELIEKSIIYNDIVHENFSHIGVEKKDSKYLKILEGSNKKEFEVGEMPYQYKLSPTNPNGLNPINHFSFENITIEKKFVLFNSGTNYTDKIPTKTKLRYKYTIQDSVGRHGMIKVQCIQKLIDLEDIRTLEIELENPFDNATWNIVISFFIENRFGGYHKKIEFFKGKENTHIDISYDNSDNKYKFWRDGNMVAYTNMDNNSIFIDKTLPENLQFTLSAVTSMFAIHENVFYESLALDSFFSLGQD